MSNETILSEAENDLARRQKRVDVEALYRKHAAPAIAGHRKTQQDIRAVIEEVDSDFLRLARLNKSIGDSTLSNFIQEYRVCCATISQIEKGVEWLESLDVEEELNSRPATREQFQIACRRLDARLGERCYVGDVVGRIRSLHTQAMDRFADLQKKAKQQGVSLFAAQADEAGLLPPALPKGEAIEVVTNQPDKDLLR
jgi:hypothetical protein